MSHTSPMFGVDPDTKIPWDRDDCFPFDPVLELAIIDEESIFNDSEVENHARYIRDIQGSAASSFNTGANARS